MTAYDKAIKIFPMSRFKSIEPKCICMECNYKELCGWCAPLYREEIGRIMDIIEEW